MKTLSSNKNQTIFLLFTLLTVFINLTLVNAQQFKSYTAEGLISYQSNPQIAIELLKKKYKEATEKKDTIQIIKTLISLSAADRAGLAYRDSFINSGEALFIAQEFKNPLLIAKAHEEFGTLHFLFKQDDEAGEHFKKAHDYYSKVNLIDSAGYTQLYRSHYNLAMYYQRIKNVSELKKQIAICESLAEKFKTNPIYKLYLEEKKVSELEFNSQFKEALYLLVNLCNRMEALKANGQLGVTDNSFFMILYCRTAINYERQNNHSAAKNYFEKALQIKDSNGENTFYRSFVFLRYAELLFKINDYKNAYLNLQESKLINDTYLNPRNEDTQGFLTIKNRYKDQLQNKNNQLRDQNLEIEKQNQALFRFRFSFFGIILVAIILVLIFRSKLRTIKHQKEEQITKKQIELKNKELTANMLQLIEKEEIIQTLKSHLENATTDNNTKKVIQQLEKNSVSLWDSFNNQFMELNEHFYEKLQEKAPDLSASDLKVCALIKLNFSGKEMAHLLGISLGSVHVARHRLRKKMNLERDINLTNFINSI
jgi:DNA-binding CsgD family transcriptional regulator